MTAGPSFNTSTTVVAEALAEHPHSPWRSPVPYLFGGLAAMMSLIAFSLLILACSSWKLSGYLDGSNGGEGDVESGDGKPVDSVVKPPQQFEERIVVIMAGDKKPTFLATPISSRAFSFGDSHENKQVDDGNKKEDDEKPETQGDRGLKIVQKPNSNQGGGSHQIQHQNQDQ